LVTRIVWTSGPRRWAWLLIAVMLLVVYLPITGHLLRTDDLSRINDNRQLTVDYFGDLFLDNKSDGFYRPLNHLSFGLTYRLFGMNPWPYGLFNLLLLAGSAVLLFRIGEILSGDSLFALLVTAGWLANAKVISATLIWAVGRTTGLQFLFSLLALYTALKIPRRRAAIRIGLSGLFLVLALLSKESAVMAGPFILVVVWHRRRTTDTVKTAHLAALALLYLGVLLLYCWLRRESNAMGVMTAPDYYRMTLSPANLFHNLAGYLERSLLFSVILLPALGWALAGTDRGRGIPARRRVIQLFGWLLCFLLALAPTILLPLRSSLYVYGPSVFVVGALVWFWKTSPRWPADRRVGGRIVAVLALLVIVSIPVAWGIGRQEVQLHGHTMDWARVIDRAMADRPASAAVIRYDETEFAGTRLTERDFHFLGLALDLMGRPIRILVNPHRPEPDAPVFILHRSADDPVLGRLQPVP
jgi:hypothetical protein